MDHVDSNQWISSVHLMQQTGISRATLNNYIRLGILPRPLIKKPMGERSRAKKIGYFSSSVLGIIEKIRTLKKEGYRINEIAMLIRAGVASEYEKATADIGTTDDQTSLFPEAVLSRTSLQSDEVTMTFYNIRCPAYFLNRNCEVDWINEEGERLLFHREIRSIREGAMKNIFMLLLDPSGAGTEEERRVLIKLHMGLVQARYGKGELVKLLDRIPAGKVKELLAIYEGSTAEAGMVVDRYCRLPDRQGRSMVYYVSSIDSREGILVFFNPVGDIPHNVLELLFRRERIIEETLHRRMPNIITFCVLAAELESSRRLRAALPPEEYLDLINGLWETIEGSFKKYYGAYGRHGEEGAVYYFLQTADTDYIMNALSCALELKEKMKYLSVGWQIRKGWLHDLYINIGITEGREYFGTSPAYDKAFISLGNAADQARCLANFSRHGTIWTTKRLINQLPPQDREKLRFGIVQKKQNQEIFLERLFAPVGDLLDREQPFQFMEIAELPVTQIISWLPS